MARTANTGRTYRGKAAGDRNALRRARFFEAGLELFGTNGFTSITVKALCTEARLTERYFYESFDNREQLFMEVAARCVAGLMARLTAVHGKVGAEIDLLPRAMLEAFFRWFEEDPRRARIQLVEPLVMGPRFHSLYRDVTAMFVDMLRTTSLRRYEATLRARQLDPDILATALVGAAVEIVKEWMLGGFKKPLDDLVRTMAFLVDALAPEPAARRAKVQP